MSDYRPVPLTWLYCSNDDKGKRAKLSPLLDQAPVAEEPAMPLPSGRMSLMAARAYALSRQSWEHTTCLS